MTDTNVHITLAFFKNAENVNPLEGENVKQSFSIEDTIIKMYVSNMRYRHCEIAFPKTLFVNEGQSCSQQDFKLKACGILRNGTVFLKDRNFEKDAYILFQVKVPKKTAILMYKFCLKQVGKPYDYISAKRSAIWPTKYTGKSWYCTNLTVAILQQGGFLTGMDPNALSVDDVYDLMQEHRTQTPELKPLDREKLAKISRTGTYI